MRTLVLEQPTDSAPARERELLYLFGLIAAAAYATYFAPKFGTNAFWALVLGAYFYSKNEPFWLAFFLTISDGFWGFFDNYEAVLSIIPGLPPIEVGHFYIILAAIKASRKPASFQPFYNPMLIVLGSYVLFLVLQGYAIGLKGTINAQFKMLKHIMPLLIFVSLPRLMDRMEDYRKFFYYFMPMAFTSLFAQLFTISSGVTPAQALGLHKEAWFIENLKRGSTYRGFYSTGAVLISFLGSLFYLADKKGSFPRTYLVVVAIANFFAAYLSATRGWVVGFTLSMLLCMLFVYKLTPKYIFTTSAGFIAALTAMSYIPAFEKQITDAFERILTLQSLAGGDLSAGGTLIRLSTRSPIVLGYWKESWLTGWGFSDFYFAHNDVHVANQNILMHSGIIGFTLLLAFFAYFLLRLWQAYKKLPKKHNLRDQLLVFPMFFIGWFFIHSTSGQLFGYYFEPDKAFPLAIFISLGAVIYRQVQMDKEKAHETNES
jgi:hypothetical protein